MPLLVYNTLAFGSPFHLGYASEEGFQEMHAGFFGIKLTALFVIVTLSAFAGSPAVSDAPAKATVTRAILIVVLMRFLSFALQSGRP